MASLPMLLVLCCGMMMSAGPITPLPQKVEYDAAKAQLGKELFFDPVLSRDNTVACASCHDLWHGGDDGKAVSIGVKGRKGKLNALTVYNSRYNFRHFWDGRADGLHAQVFMSIGDPNEMDQSVEMTLQKLRGSAHYRQRFTALYREGITRRTVEDAITEFENALVTPDAPFDRYLRGEKEAISREARTGYRLFRSKGCILCHNGRNIGGNFYNKFGVFKEIASRYPGRYALTHNEEDRMLFRVPSLRNVALTAPYMHEGQVPTLKEAVEIMSKHQLGREMTEEEIDNIVAFLRTLTGMRPDIVGAR